MAQLGDLPRARDLLRRAARAFGAGEPAARARCVVAEAEIALVSRDLGRPSQAPDAARATLEAHGDRTNAAHAAYLEARRLLLIGRLDEAEWHLDGLDADALPPASRAGAALVAAGIAMRRIRAGHARDALDLARRQARRAGIPALIAEVERASRALDAPAGRWIGFGGERWLRLDEIETLLASDALVVDACRNIIRAGTIVIPLASRPVLFALARALAEAWPADVSREGLLARAFRARHADESHRARLRVEFGRLRKALAPLAGLNATKRGFVLAPRGAGAVAALAPLVEGEHMRMLALLADGEAWSSSALARALGVSARTAQRALDGLAEAGKVESFGRGRALRWMAPSVPGFPTRLLLPAPPPHEQDNDMKHAAAEITREYGPFEGVERVAGVSFDGRRVWFGAGDKLTSLDPESGELLSAHEIPADAGTAFDGKHLFQIGGGVIRKVDLATGEVLATIPAPGGGGDSGLAWAEGSLWVGQHRGQKIHQIDPRTGAVLRTIESDRFVTGVTWVEGELWHGTWQVDMSELRRVDPSTGEVLERLEMPEGIGVSGLESDGGERFFCGGGRSGKMRVARRPIGVGGGSSSR